MTSPEADMLTVVGPLWSAEKTRSELGLADSELVERRRAGTVLGVQSNDGTWFYPLSQFEPHAAGVRVRPGLVEFFTVLRRHDPWTVAMVAASSAPELGGVSPVAWAGENRDVESLLALAHVLVGEWA